MPICPECQDTGWYTPIIRHQNGSTVALPPEQCPRGCVARSDEDEDSEDVAEATDPYVEEIGGSD